MIIFFAWSYFFFFSSRRRHTRSYGDWSSDVCSSDLMEGLAELRVKESDRLAATAAGLAVNGVSARIDGEALIVGGGRDVRGGSMVATHRSEERRVGKEWRARSAQEQ